MSENPPSSQQLFRFATIFYLLLALAGVLWWGVRVGVLPSELFFRPRAIPLDLLVGATGGGLLAGGWWLLLRALPLARALEVRLGGLLRGLDRPQILALGVYSGLAEELFFRGAMQSAWGFVTATALFALLHTGRGREMGLWTLFALAAGALFGGLVLWRGTLLPACVAHFTVNVVGLERILRRSDPSEAS